MRNVLTNQIAVFRTGRFYITAVLRLQNLDSSWTIDWTVDWTQLISLEVSQ